MNEDKLEFESVRPINYRELELSIDGQATVIAGMAKPDYRTSNIDESLTYLTQPNHDRTFTFDTLIGLHPEKKYYEAAKSYGLAYKPMRIKDFTAPTQNIFENTYQILKQAIKRNQHVAIHCGEGFGRTGTVLTALKLRELIYAMPMDQIHQQAKHIEFELGPQAKFKKLYCTPLVNKAILKVRRGDENDDSVENELQIKSLEKYHQFLIIQRRNEFLKELETTLSSSISPILLQAQSTFFELQDLHEKRQQVEVSIDDKKSYFTEISNISSRLDSASSELLKLKEIQSFDSEAAKSFHEQLVQQYESYIQNFIMHFDEVMMPVMDEYFFDPDLLPEKARVLDICHDESFIDYLNNPPNNFLVALEQLVGQLQAHKIPIQNNGVTLIQGDMKTAVDQCLLYYHMVSEVDKQSLPKDVHAEMALLSQLLSSPGTINDKASFLLNIRLASLTKLIKSNQKAMEQIKATPEMMKSVIQDRQNDQRQKVSELLSKQDYIGDKVQTNLFLTHFFKREQLVGAISQTDLEELLNEPIFLERVSDVKLVVEQVPTDALDRYLITNKDILSNTIFSTSDNTAELLNQLDPQRQRIVLQCIQDTLSEDQLNEEYISRLHEMLDDNDAKDALVDTFNQQIKSLELPIHKKVSTPVPFRNPTTSFAKSGFGFFTQPAKPVASDEIQDKKENTPNNWSKN